MTLRFKDYGFKYSIADHASLARVNLDLPAGRLISVVAPQGKGKTTLLRAAAGLLGEIYSGEVTGSIESPGPCAAFFDGYVQVTLAVETVREEIGLPLLASGLARAERDARAAAVAAELRIEHLLERQVTQLSGGEEKLVGIAAALAPDAAVHVLDEPFEQLDVVHLASVIRAAKRRARLGRVVLVATSSLDIAVNIGDALLTPRTAGWVLVDRPTYADLGELGESPVLSFLSTHHATSTFVRRFRDVARITS